MAATVLWLPVRWVLSLAPSYLSRGRQSLSIELLIAMVEVVFSIRISSLSECELSSLLA